MRYTKFLLLFILAFAQGCATFGEVDPQAKPYLDSFVSEAHERGYYPNVDNLSIYIKPKDSLSMELVSDNALAYCMPLAIGTSRDRDFIPSFGEYIIISKEYWDAAPDAGREDTLFHELGHCILNRVHTTKLLPMWDGTYRPASLMYPTDFPGIIYLEYRKEYIDELFENAPFYIKHRLMENGPIKATK